LSNPTKWTDEALASSASKYTSVKDWRTTEPSAYSTACQRGLLKKLAAHMLKGINHGYWTEERVLKSARKFKHKSEWAKAAISAPQAARRLGIYDIATAHMEALGNKKKRCVYVISISSTNIVYIGLTGNPKRRFRDHLISNRFIELSDEYGQDAIIFEQLTDFVDVDEAAEMEGEYVEKFKQKGCILLNKMKTGGVGGIDKIWTDEKILADAAKYLTLKIWREDSAGAYAAAGRKGLLDEVTAHMERRRSAWDRQGVIDNARQFLHKVRWKEKFPGAVHAARDLGVWDEAIAHMEPLSERGKWTEEAILAEAGKYQKIAMWQKNSVGSYEASLRKGMMSQATAHMRNVKVHEWTPKLLGEEKDKYSSFEEWKKKAPNSFLKARQMALFGLIPPVPVPKRVNKWNKKSVIESAQKYPNKPEWRVAESGAYASAKRNGWMKEASAHMEILNPLGKWASEETVVKEARRYETKSEWQRVSSGSYEAAKRLGCFNEAIEHMRLVRQSWTKEKVIASARNFKTIAGWRQKNSSAYAAAHRLKIVKQATAHMMILNPIGAWLTKEAVVSDAKKYMSRTSWYKGSGGAYASAKRNGWFEEAVKHM